MAQWRFDVVLEPERYQLLLFPRADPNRVVRALWTEGQETLVWDGASGRYGQVGTLEQALDLAIGPRAADGLTILLPPGNGESNPDPTIRVDQWIDAASGLVHKTMTTIDSPEAAMRQAMGNQGLPARGAAPPPTIWRVEIETRLALDEVLPPHFTPPSTAVAIGRWETTTLEAPTAGDPLDQGFGEVIDVQISNLVVRVVDSHGEPVSGLQPEDFSVRLGRQETTVLAADWVDLMRYQPETMAGVRRAGRVAPIPSRLTEPPLVLFFVQAGLDSSYTRGAMRFQQVADELLAGLPPGSRVGVVGFDSQLRLRLDFSTDKRRILEALDRSIRFGGLGTERKQPAPSLAAVLDFEAARRAANPEDALRVTAEALAEFSGEKTLLYLGWGLGRFGRGGVRMTPDYEPARAALREADVTVFVLDTTDADYHSLEVGLEQVARDTGGTYEKTNQFPARAAKRLGRTLAGYYVLAVDRSGLEADRKRWKVELTDREVRRAATVLVVPTPR